MSLADIAVLTVVAFVLAASLVVARWRLRRVDREIRAYGLYAVRDELVQLVAEKRLSEDNMIFTTFYGTTNKLVRNVDHLNFRDFVAVIEEGRRSGKDPAEQKRLAELRHQIRSLGDERVERVVSSYFDAILKIIYDNSVLIRLLADHAWLRRLLRRLANWINRPRPPQVEIYSSYSRAARQCC